MLHNLPKDVGTMMYLNVMKSILKFLGQIFKPRGTNRRNVV